MECKRELNKKIVIEIFDTHKSDVETFKLDISTVGTISGKPDDYSISYTEHGGELDGCLITLSVKDGKCVTMTRTGNYNSELIIEQDRRHSCHYSTPYGDFMMGVFAKKVDSSIGDGGGTLSLEYTLDFNSDWACQNELTINVKEIP
jgi:uncharacterized beta-barrel protein YwiB (DUF1934 family)